MTPSSSPPMAPTSASTLMPLAWALATTSLVFSMFSAMGYLEPSNMTEEKPFSMASMASS